MELIPRYCEARIKTEEATTEVRVVSGIDVLPGSSDGPCCGLVFRNTAGNVVVELDAAGAVDLAWALKAMAKTSVDKYHGRPYCFR